ncbi:MAG: pseudouridine synthase [[Clostridium] aminophilum]|uniref:pseudouridine synthase n=1 Tax=[Clostridium] aminophilum TaxID=1526 RepID=UPI0026EDF9A7|nr:pseudouridine synthase [[Clostridium] aminophilum]MDD6195382.1 pseudouridine synthase [[Clostridium] aminophilum]
MDNEGKRLNKYISDAGIASRREADRLIEEGKVQIRRHSRKDEPEKMAETASVGDRVFHGDTVYVEGRELPKKEVERVYYLYNKPCGVVCTMNRSIEGNLADAIRVPQRVVYAGRLDKDSSGLLILTNDGALSDQIMRASHFHEKEYVVTVGAPLRPEFLDQMSRGVKIHLDDDATLRKHPDGLWVTTRPCKVKRIGERKFSIVLTQGYNRQIRRMCRALGVSVSGIERVRIMNLRIGELPCGSLREMTEEEKGKLLELAGMKNTDEGRASRPRRKEGWAVAKPDRSDRKPRSGWNGRGKDVRTEQGRKNGTKADRPGKKVAVRQDIERGGRKAFRPSDGRKPWRNQTGKKG